MKGARCSGNTAFLAYSQWAAPGWTPHCCWVICHCPGGPTSVSGTRCGRFLQNNSKLVR